MAPNLSGSSNSGGDQRKVTPPVDVDALDAAVAEPRSPAILVSPTSARQAQPSSETRMFPCNKISVVAQERAGIVLLSGHHGRGRRYADTGDHVWHPLAATEFNEEMRKTERSTCQFQWIGLRVFPQELDDVPVFHPRRHHCTFFVVHHDPN